MTDQASTPDDDEEARLVALSRFAKASAAALQGALQFAAQSEQSLATSVAALVEGLTVDDVAVRVRRRLLDTTISIAKHLCRAFGR